MLGYIKRTAKCFDDALALKMLYTALVRSGLEYAWPIWCPYQQLYIDLLESVQHKFLRFAAYRLGRPMDVMDHDYQPIMDAIDIQSLESRRKLADVLLFFNLLNGYTDCPEILQEFVRRVPVRLTRNPEHFVARAHRTNYGNHSLVPHLIRYANEFPSIHDIFGVPRSLFRADILRPRL